MIDIVRPPWIDRRSHRRQATLLEAIRTFAAQHGYPPTVRDLQRATGTSSVSVVHYHLTALERRGLIAREPAVARSIRIVEHEKARS